MRKVSIFLVCTFALALFVPSFSVFAGPWEDLYKAAKSEGKLVWQVGVPVAYVKDAINGFKKRFPGIEVEAIRVAGTAMVARMAAEAAAKRVSVDVAMGSLPRMGPLVERDLLVKEDLDNLPNLDRKAILLEGRYFATYSMVLGIIYNTNLVPPNKVPKKWEDLLNPEWKNKISVGRTTLALGVLLQVWDENKAVNYLKALRKQGLVIANDLVTAGNRCADGETAFGDTSLTLMPRYKKKKIPVDVAPISPQRDVPYGTYTVKGAKHPNAAKLLKAFLITPEGKALWAKTGRGPSTPCDASPLSRILCEKGIKSFPIFSMEAIAKDVAAVEKTREILGTKPPK